MTAPRTPPHDLDAEEAVLGACLLDDGACIEAEEVVAPGDFYKPAHANTFAAIRALELEGVRADAVTVHARMVHHGTAEGVGVVDLLRLVANVPHPGSVRHYAEIVRELARKRRLAGTGAELSEAAFDATKTSAEVLTDVEARLLKATEEQTALSGPVMAADAIGAVIERLDTAQELGGIQVGLGTGFRDLDAIVRGMAPGNLVIVAGRSGMGKTAWLVGSALANAQRDTPTLFVSLEMTRDEIVKRTLCQISHVSQHLLDDGRVTGDQRARIDTAARHIATLPLAIDERAGLNVGSLRLAARAMQARRGLGLVVVDYLQLLAPGGTRERREVEVRELAEALKALAKDLGVVVVAGSQLNREPDKRPDHRPLLSDLRESGGVEQAADLVIGLYRDAYYDPGTDPGVAEALVLKNRSGPTGAAKLAWLPTCAAFTDLAHYAEPGR